MTEELIIEIGKRAIETTALVSSPMLIGALAIGLVISIMQAITQINEATLTFIPKIAVVMIVLLIAAPWMLDLIGKFTVNLYESIPMYVRH
ncbi:MAG: flagellar biosynthetic protein FliQ [Bdellovibrionaceae bacterium]|nr:flagellar biosynthetic protein FliQ [Pseudobdellovibrionaceae bacterium]|tara:strand:- start:26862 stop:27134 length:273 start_codon:yes stop_codon:yes gene_type:complete